jgi:hypothetical protein
MGKTILKFDSDDQFDFILVGIACQHRDYRLCHELNTHLKIELARENDYEIFNGKRMEKMSFSFYHYKSGEDDHYYLLSNKSRQGLLIPEQKLIDFFLVIRENVKRIAEPELISRLKEVNVALGVFKIDTKNLKSRDNLLF